MTDDTWRDRVVGARMTVDTAFEDRVTASSFSRQQWQLLMTAVKFEIVDPTNPDSARIVANTEHLNEVLPELDAVEQQMGAMGTRGGGNQGGLGNGSSGPAILSTIRDLLGLGSSGSTTSDESRREEATTLLQEYADEFQAHLEAEGRWEDVRSMAAEER